MKRLVFTFMPQDQLAKTNDALTGVVGMVEPFGTSLNNEERMGSRSMKEGREGYARTTSRVSLEFVDSLPRNEDPAELQASLAYYDELARVRVKAARVLEIIDDTAMALGVDIMAMADRYTSYLQTAREGNTSLDAALQQIDEYNKRFAIRPNEEDAPVEETPVETPAK
jgi:hypothetical protein